MPRDNRVSVRLVVGLALAVVFDTIQQLVWKMGMGDIPDTATPRETIEAALREPLLGVVAVLMLVRLINWLKVLELADLSYAQPITSLSYVLQQAAGGIIIIPPSGQGEIYQGVVSTPTNGGPRVEGMGTNSIPFDFFYTLPDGGRGAVITITPNFRDDNGNVSSQTLTLRVL